MSRRDIQHALGLSDRKSLRQRYLLPALQCGYLEMTRADAPSARNQKYRLTPLGQRVGSPARMTRPRCSRPDAATHSREPGVAWPGLKSRPKSGQESAYSGSTVTSLIATCDSSRMLLVT